MKDNLKVLVVAPFYDSFPFVGELIDATSKYVEHIDVLIHHNYLAELAPYIPLPYFRWVERFTKRNLVGLKPKPKNVDIHLLSTLYFVPDGRNKKLGDKLYRKFSKYIRDNGLEFDIIHAHVHWPQGYVAVKLKKEFGVPAVVTVHTSQIYLKDICNHNTPKYKHIHYVFENADALTRVNKAGIPCLKRFNPRVYYVPNGFNPEKLPILPREEARKKLGISQDIYVIFSLGRLIKRKGFNYLVEAMAKVVKHKKDIVCFIGGAGEEMVGKLKKQIIQLGLKENVKLLGFVPCEDLKYWMNASDLFVFPSLSESFGLAVLEALAVGTPVVSTINGGSEEIITSEDYGLLCPPADPECLAEKILIALDKDWDREKIRKYAEQFTWDNIAKQVVRIYSDVLGGSDK